MVRTAKVKIFKKLFTKHRGRGGGAEGLLGEVPAGGDLGGDLERVLVREHSHLEKMPPALMSFWHVRALIFIISSWPRGSAAAALQQLVHGAAWVLRQCVPDALVPAVVVHVDVGLCQVPDPLLGAAGHRRRRRVHLALLAAVMPSRSSGRLNSMSTGMSMPADAVLV